MAKKTAMIAKTPDVPAPEDMAPDNGRVEVVDEEPALVVGVPLYDEAGGLVAVLYDEPAEFVGGKPVVSVPVYDRPVVGTPVTELL